MLGCAGCVALRRSELEMHLRGSHPQTTVASGRRVLFTLANDAPECRTFDGGYGRVVLTVKIVSP
jgi:hypothetical protein